MDEDTRPIEETETLGQRIRRIRQDRGMSLAKVVRDDFSRAFLNQVEMGKTRPSIRLLRVIAERLGTEVEYLLEGHEAGVDRELAVEKGRVLLLQGESRRALLALKPALDTYDWPTGCDARVCQAQALIALGRKDQADAILAHEQQEMELHNDRHRLERLKAIEQGRQFRYQGDAVKVHLQLADRAQRAGQSHDELEHYRAARVLLEAGP
ncbi:MAG: helix-turn-helix domain-containing protein [Chloroflexi bacterium]|jgi:transcriptional regulator with XRE-family HTH domain|nr:MAG: helix-turn-helix domain-containing protein [Chloroflexota bacterium]TMG27371.1 MAG: helix-turn-helix domain-containing protein [Chloroflexota bacterium]